MRAAGNLVSAAVTRGNTGWSGATVSSPQIGIQGLMDFLATLTPDEGLFLLAVAVLTLLACLGITIWALVS
jgi:hypothetical protein